jgi:hypothetical protein
MRVAIMQPYFIPYAGYFRLFCATDLFVIYDCVQFVRRGWIHRNRLLNRNNQLEWLTLPLKKMPQQTQIQHIAFADDCNMVWPERLRVFPKLFHEPMKDNELLQNILQLGSSPLELIVNSLKKTCNILGFQWNAVYSSSLCLPESIRGQDRIIEIAKHFGATEYINLSGGRELYNADEFKKHAIKLKFLSEYSGSYDSILERLSIVNVDDLSDEIADQSKIND